MIDLKKKKWSILKLETDLKRQIRKHCTFTSLPEFTNQVTLAPPIVRSVNCHTTNISKYINYHLQPVVIQITSYIKDTNNFINKINDIGNIPPNSNLVTMSIKSLWTKIPNSEEIAAVKNAHNNYQKKNWLQSK